MRGATGIVLCCKGIRGSVGGTVFDLRVGSRGGRVRGGGCRSLSAIAGVVTSGKKVLGHVK